MGAGSHWRAGWGNAVASHRCVNYLTVTGSAADVRRFWRETHPDPPAATNSSSQRVLDSLACADEPALTFERARPTPVHFGDADLIVAWRERNWGVCCDAEHAKLVGVSEQTLAYEFETLREAPVSWFAAVAAEHPTCEFELRYITDDGYTGTVFAQGGDLTHVP